MVICVWKTGRVVHLNKFNDYIQEVHKGSEKEGSDNNKEASVFQLSEKPSAVHSKNPPTALEEIHENDLFERLVTEIQ